MNQPNKNPSRSKTGLSKIKNNSLRLSAGKKNSGKRKKFIKIAKCYFCGYIVNKREPLSNHISTHTKEYFKCSRCSETFKNPLQLRSHMRKFHTRRKFSCEKCSSLFSEKMVYQNHLLTHAKPSVSCSQCPKSFYTEPALKLHFRNHHSGELFKCNQCEKIFSCKSSLDLHVRVIHMKTTKHPCVFCKRGFFVSRDLRNHMNREHLGQQDLTSCPEPGCPLVFKSSDGAHRHRLKCHPRENEKDKFRCKLCSRKYSSAMTLKSHLVRAHGAEGQHKCSFCGKSFHERRTFETHVSMNHTDEKAFRCERAGCEKAYASQKNLNRHIKTLHEAVKKDYICELCPALVFKKEDGLRFHKRQYHVQRKFFCYFCSAVKNQQTHLMSHVRTHTLEKPHQCRKCLKEFSVVGCLKTHMNKCPKNV